MRALDLNEKRTATPLSLLALSIPGSVRPRWKEDSNCDTFICLAIDLALDLDEKRTATLHMQVDPQNQFR